MKKIKKMWSKILGIQEGDIVELTQDVTFLTEGKPLETFKKGTRFKVKRVLIGNDILLERRGRLFLTTKKKVRLVE